MCDTKIEIRYPVGRPRTAINKCKYTYSDGRACDKPTTNKLCGNHAYQLKRKETCKKSPSETKSHQCSRVMPSGRRCMILTTQLFCKNHKGKHSEEEIDEIIEREHLFREVQSVGTQTEY